MGLAAEPGDPRVIRKAVKTGSVGQRVDGATGGLCRIQCCREER
jgi:hypothetical protein